jgi:formylglycine-generating enzyme required for sulfatase activity
LRSYDGVSADAMDNANPANVGKFSLDLLEVTVGRFRRFVNAGGGVHATAPSDGAGAVPGTKSGWKSAYTDELLADKNELVTALHCHDFATWTNTADAVGSGEARPINCITWYEAQAFCVWDGGRLPSEAEWNYAAAGGQQRVYPWSVPADNTSISCAQASLYLNDSVKCCAFDEKPAAQSCSSADILVAGSKSGKGFWDQRDLGGNVAEWVLDYYAPNYKNPCDDCVESATSDYRVLRGGSYFSGPAGLTASSRDANTPSTRAPDIGFRCAYGR